jgi:predicted GH43/DUF377 family glycosyl hydrolase
MKWEKKGLIISPNDSRIPNWGRKKITVPTPIVLSDDIIRIYLGFCAEDNVGRIGFVDVSSNNPSEIIKVSNEPLLNIGEKGSFDDCGVVSTCIIKEQQNYTLFYAGFFKDEKNPYYMFLGSANSKDGGETFNRNTVQPLLGKTRKEQLFRTGAFVLKDDLNWKMWYIGGNEWQVINGKQLPIYRCNVLTSDNLLQWNDDFQICLDFESEEEHGFSRPWILKKDNKYVMYYSIRKVNIGYTPGYAESYDGIIWKRKDNEIGIELSKTGWDSEMICYPAVVNVKDKTFMFYNGNNFGDTGFGYAELVKNEQ